MHIEHYLLNKCSSLLKIYRIEIPFDVIFPIFLKSVSLAADKFYHVGEIMIVFKKVQPLGARGQFGSKSGPHSSERPRI